MKVFRAVYGEKEDAHALLAATEMPTVSALPYVGLEGLTDRAGTPPPGVYWEPYLSGYPYKGYYVLTRTFPDTTASRPGMVRTYAILIPLKDIAVANLGDLIALLPTVPTHAAGFVADPRNTKDIVFSPLPPVPPGYPELVTALIDVARGHAVLPIIWADQEGFEAVITTLWSHLWPDGRCGLHFRLSFGPLDVEAQPSLTLVCTPSRLTGRWASPYRTIHVSSSDARSIGRSQSNPLSRSEALLLGLTEGEPLRVLMRDLEVPFASVKDLPRLERCLDALMALSTSDDAERADVLRRAARLVAGLTPLPNNAKQLKHSLMEPLGQLTATESATGLLALRNFPFAAFDNGIASLDDWATTWVQIEMTRGTEPVGTLILTAWNSDSPWATAVRSAFLSVISVSDMAIVSIAVWRWWIENTETLHFLSQGVATSADMEKALVVACPAHITETLANAVAALAQARKWFDLHAVVLSVGLPAPLAIRRHLAFDSDLSRYEPLSQMAKRLKPYHILDAALETSDVRLLQLIGEVATRDVSLLKLSDLERKEWRLIWAVCVAGGGRPLAAIPSPESAVHTLMDTTLRGEYVPVELYEYVATTPHANLSRYDRRAEVWSLLPEGAAYGFLHATAQGWLDLFILADSVTNTDLDKRTRDVILRDIYDGGWLLRPEVTADVAVRTFSRFADIKENHLCRWLISNPSAMSDPGQVTGGTLGMLVQERRWQRAAQILYQRATNYSRGWLTAADRCSVLLGFLERLHLYAIGGSHTVTRDEWWRAFTDLAADLYPHGVTERNIWRRSGGDESQIELWRSGREQWEIALRLLNQGGGGKHLRRAGLLHQMRKDFYDNDQLRLIENMQERV